MPATAAASARRQERINAGDAEKAGLENTETDCV